MTEETVAFYSCYRQGSRECLIVWPLHAFATVVMGLAGLITARGRNGVQLFFE